MAAEDAETKTKEMDILEYYKSFLDLEEDDYMAFSQYHRSSDLFDEYYAENHSVVEINRFEMKLAKTIANISLFASKHWHNKAGKYFILLNLISFTAYIPNVDGSIYLTSEFIQLIIKALNFEGEDAASHTIKWLALLLLANISFNFETKTKEMMNHENVVNTLIETIKNDNNGGQCKLTLMSYIIINLHEKESDLQWLFDMYPTIFDNICNEWKCALAEKEIEYDDWSYIPGCWMRAHILNILTSCSYSNNFIQQLVQEKNIFEYLTAALQFEEDMITKTILLHKNSCNILYKISNNIAYHSYFLEYQFDKGNLFEAMREIEKNEIEEYSSAIKYCKLITENIRNVYLDALTNISFVKELLHLNLIQEIVCFVW